MIENQVWLDPVAGKLQVFAMNKLWRLGIFTATALNCIFVHAGPNVEKTEQTGCNLNVELRDGSRIIGKCREENFKFSSDSLGQLKLPLKKVSSIEIPVKGKKAKLVTAAQDTMMVEFAMKNIRVDAAFGEVTLPVEMIKSLRVSAYAGPGVPTDGLIGLWTGDGNAKDSVAGNNGRNENVTFVNGVAGKAFSFAPGAGFGHRVCVDIDDKPEYALSHSLSVDAWIRPRGDGNVVISRGDRRPGFDPYTISMDGHHTVDFQITDDNGESAEVHADNIPYGQWTHVAGTLDGDTGMLRIYTNGVLAAEMQTSIRPIGELIQNLTPGLGIGNVNDGMNNFPFVGDICEVGLYNRALSAGEVKAIYGNHAATASEKAGLLPPRGSQRLGFHNGLRPVPGNDQ